MKDKLKLQIIEIIISATVAGLTTGAGLLALLHQSNWTDAIYVFIVPFLSTVAVGLRNLYKDNPINEPK